MTIAGGNGPPSPPRLAVPIRISARADYATRACAELAADPAGRMSGDQIAAAQNIPLKFLLNILTELSRGNIVHSHRGTSGGYQLTRPASQITIAEILHAAEGPAARIRGFSPQELHYTGAAEHLREVWVAVQATLENLLQAVTLADLVAGTLPPTVATLTRTPPPRPASPRPAGERA